MRPFLSIKYNTFPFSSTTGRIVPLLNLRPIPISIFNRFPYNYATNYAKQKDQNYHTLTLFCLRCSSYFQALIVLAYSSIPIFSSILISVKDPLQSILCIKFTSVTKVLNSSAQFRARERYSLRGRSTPSNSFEG